MKGNSEGRKIGKINGKEKRKGQDENTIEIKKETPDALLISRA